MYFVVLGFHMVGSTHIVVKSDRIMVMVKVFSRQYSFMKKKKNEKPRVYEKVNISFQCCYALANQSEQKSC